MTRQSQQYSDARWSSCGSVRCHDDHMEPTRALRTSDVAKGHAGNQAVRNLVSLERLAGTSGSTETEPVVGGLNPLRVKLEPAASCCFDRGQRRILLHLCHLLPEQIDALDRVLPRIRRELLCALPRQCVDARVASFGPKVDPRSKHRAICTMMRMLDDALHAGFAACYGTRSSRVYAPRVSSSAKSAFLDVANICYDAAGFSGISAAKAIDSYRRSLLRDGISASCMHASAVAS